MQAIPLALRGLSAIYGAQDALRRALESDPRLSGYSNSEMQLLFHLDEPLRMGQIAHALHCLPSNVTALVDQLEKRKLVSREPCPDDRRARQLVLTGLGRRERIDIIAAASEVFETVTGISGKDLDKLLALFDQTSRRSEK